MEGGRSFEDRFSGQRPTRQGEVVPRHEVRPERVDRTGIELAQYKDDPTLLTPEVKMKIAMQLGDPSLAELEPGQFLETCQS